MMEENQNKRIISSLLAAIACGVFMCALILISINISGILIRGIPLFLIIVAAAALPMCTVVFKQRGLDLNVIVLLMIAVSFVICFIYAAATALTSETRYRMLGMIGLIHGISLLVNGLMLVIQSRRRADHE